jgi:hypothetical protein
MWDSAPVEERGRSVRLPAGCAPAGSVGIEIPIVTGWYHSCPGTAGGRRVSVCHTRSQAPLAQPEVLKRGAAEMSHRPALGPGRCHLRLFKAGSLGERALAAARRVQAAARGRGPGLPVA